MPLLTHSLIHSAGTKGVGFNRAQLQLLGIAWPPKKGWLSKLIGTQVSDETWQKVVRLRSVRRKAERFQVLRDDKYNPRLF